MARNTAVGVIAYNGFQFPSIMHASISGGPIFDKSRRTVKYYQWTIRLQGTLVAEDGPTQVVVGTQVDSNITSLRRVLTLPAKELVFTDQGFGDFVVNNGMVSEGTSKTPGGVIKNVLDSAYGPVAKFILWNPVASNRAANVIWECTTKIPQGCTNPNFKKELAEFNYSVSWNIGNNRRTTRVVTGLLEIPATRINAISRNIPDTADAYRNRIDFLRIPGFQRLDTYSLSDDKRILSFSITDTEINSNNPYPPGIIRMSARHSVSSNLESKGFNIWDNVISGRVEVHPDYQKQKEGFAAIQNLLNSRLLQSRKQGKVRTALTGDSKKKREARSAINLVTNISIEEEIYGNGIDFSVSYWITSTLSDLLSAVGIFQPVPGEWSKWSASISDAIPHRGFARLGHKASDDVIIDLCKKAPFKSPGLATQVPVRPIQTQITLDTGRKGIKEKDSFIVVDSKITIDTQEGQVPIQPIFGSSAEAKSGTISQDNKIQIHKRTPAIKALTWTVGIIRAVFPIPEPHMEKVGGEEPIPIGNPIVTTNISVDATGLPIYTTMAIKQYQIPTGIDVFTQINKKGSKTTPDYDELED